MQKSLFRPLSCTFLYFLSSRNISLVISIAKNEFSCKKTQVIFLSSNDPRIWECHIKQLQKQYVNAVTPVISIPKKWIFLGGWKDFFCDPCFSNFRIVFFHNLYSKEKAEEILQHFWHLYRNIFKLHSVFLSQCVHKPMIKPNMSEKNFFTETEFSNSCWQQVNQFPWNCLEKVYSDKT